jgi:hypothetical protein
VSDAKLGQTPPEDAHRDAVHVAIVPMVASQQLAPGTPVGLNEDRQAVMAPREKALGVVDPYLQDPVEEGQRFWLCLKPGSITSLRHDWTHPAFAVTGDEQKVASIEWLKRAADDCGVDYHSMMACVASDDYIHMGENESYKDLDYNEFAKHVKIVTGKADAYPPFSCSC